MLTNSLDDLYFSASALKTYDTCKLKFKRRYLEGLFWPSDWSQDQEDKEIFKLGQEFHRLAERYYSRGRIVDPDSLLSEQMQNWLAQLVEFRPYNDQERFYSEQELRFNGAGVKLMGKYDLLYISKEGQGIIYDWKTYKQQPRVEYWRNSLQTVVYRYLICKAGGQYAPGVEWNPDDITLIYWNPRFPKDYEPLNYSQWQFERDEARIKNLIAEIKALSHDQFYATENEKSCRYCEYRPICHGEEALRVELGEEDLELELAWDEIEEIGF
ncbi:PD-(D/E)XK nuclease family protein [Natroniella sp. ANB-PHB2]|uniref:PD-(D/E)XK nuclease family protein n=1 Tax=Natroniella sp. ANB-PHB2 TaxID=3384444 RepID=UPI0038D3B940